MKKDFETYLHDVGQQVSMTSLEKEAIFSRLKETMIASPSPVVSSYTSFSFFGYQRVASLAFVVLFLVGGVTSASAEYSFPGDFLYSFKVGVNEEVRGWFSRTPIAKAEWSIRLAERRLYEIESIRGDETLSLEIKKSLEDKFATQVDRAEQNTRDYDFGPKDPDANATLEQVTSMAASSEVPEASSFSARSIAPETASTFMKIEEKASGSEIDSSIENDREPDNTRVIIQAEDLQERIRTLRKSLRNAKTLESLDRGRILRLEARLLQSQRALIVLEKGDVSQLEKGLASITKSVFDIERTLDAMISPTEDPAAGEVLGKSVEGEKTSPDSTQKEEGARGEGWIPSLEKPAEIRGTILENQ